MKYLQFVKRVLDLISLHLMLDAVNLITPNATPVETVLQFFMLFFCNFILSRFVTQTNVYGREHYNRWTEVTLDEVKTFLAIILHMGVVKFYC